MTKSTPSTTTQVNQNPLGQAQIPYLTNMWGQAAGLGGWNFDTNTVGPAVGQQYLDQLKNYASNQANVAQGPASNLVPGGMNFVNNALSGQAGNLLPGASQIGSLNSLGQRSQDTGAYFGDLLGKTAASAPGTVAPYTSALSGLGGSALSAANPALGGRYANAGMGIQGNPIYNSLMGMASGQYVDPSRNPALAGTIQAATQPLVNQYMTATAPQTASGFEAGGRYGSGAATNAQGQNQYALGGALANATSSIVNNAYNTGLQSMLGAGSALGSAYNTGVGNVTGALSNAGQLAQSGVTNAGNLYNMAGQLGLSGLNSMMSGLGAGAGAANAGYGTAASAYGAGGNIANAGTLNLGSLAQMAPELANYPTANLATAYNTGWAPIQNYAGVLGQPIGGNTISQTTTPYYQNTGSQILSGLTGIGQLAGAFASI
jgi:hypothetical protein